MLARNLKKLRESRGLTVIQVSLDTGIPIRSLDALENTKNWVAVRTVAILCEYYGYTDIYKLITVDMRFTFNPKITNDICIGLQRN